MKCPKCSYLGFETGARCKNCGYDFSLVAATAIEPDLDRGASDPHADYEIHPRHLDTGTDDVLGDLDRHGGLSLTFAEPAPVGGVGGATVSAAPPDRRPVATSSPGGAGRGLPLFNPTQEDDEPLVKLPATPRRPLSVRRTPDTPRLRPVTRLAQLASPAPALQFSEEAVEARPALGGSAPTSVIAATRTTGEETIGGAARLLAVLIDHAILIGIDLAVVYFTVRMTGLLMTDWSLLPVVPMVIFLGLVKTSYFYAFTALGGQTIGKMAMRTCVIAENGDAVNPALAMRRTCAGALSLLTFGLGFVPALFGTRRALHDRLVGTRVIRLRSV